MITDIVLRRTLSPLVLAALALLPTSAAASGAGTGDSLLDLVLAKGFTLEALEKSAAKASSAVPRPLSPNLVLHPDEVLRDYFDPQLGWTRPTEDRPPAVRLECVQADPHQVLLRVIDASGVAQGTLTANRCGARHNLLGSLGQHFTKLIEQHTCELVPVAGRTVAMDLVFRAPAKPDRALRKVAFRCHAGLTVDSQAVTAALVTEAGHRVHVYVQDPHHVDGCVTVAIPTRDRQTADCMRVTRHGVFRGSWWTQWVHPRRSQD